MHFPGSWVLQRFITISKWFIKIPEANKTVSQDPSQFRDRRTKAHSLLPNTAAWWAVLEKAPGWDLGDFSCISRSTLNFHELHTSHLSSLGLSLSLIWNRISI